MGMARVLRTCFRETFRVETIRRCPVVGVVVEQERADCNLGIRGNLPAEYRTSLDRPSQDKRNRCVPPQRLFDEATDQRQSVLVGVVERLFTELLGLLA